MAFYVYVKDLIAIETDRTDFEWTFGRSCCQTDRAGFDSSLIRIHLKLEKDNLIARDAESEEYSSQFSSFSVSIKNKEIIFRKTLFHTVTVAYKLKLDGNDIYFSAGRAYYDLIKLRMMNMHSVRYILSDLVSGMLLLNHYVPLYCSTVCVEDKLIMIFGAPAAGKTLSAMQLIKQPDSRLLSEDVSVSDGHSVWSVPFTSTYGQHENGININPASAQGELTAQLSNSKYIFLLEKGNSKTENNDTDISKKICLLNRYIFHYDNSPINTICAYFFEEISLEQMRKNECELVKALCDHSVCAVLRESDPLLFAARISECADIDGKKKSANAS